MNFYVGVNVDVYADVNVNVNANGIILFHDKIKIGMF